MKLKLPHNPIRRRNGRAAPAPSNAAATPASTPAQHELTVDLERRRDPLVARVAELSEVERIVRMEQTGTAGSCTSCGAPHSTGATFCWQCGQPLLQQIPSDAILKR